VNDELLTPLLGDSADPVAAGWQLRKLSEGAANEGPELLREIAERSEELVKSDPAIVGGLLRVLYTVLLESGSETIRTIDVGSVKVIESSLPESTTNRHLLLQLYAMIRSEDSLALLLSSLKTTPPNRWIEASQVVSPLMQHDDWPIDAVYPEILDCLQHPSLASPVLDLANYVYRENRVDRHPAADRIAVLNHLLGEVVGRLGSFEENPRAFGDDVDAVQATLGEAVALAVSLCDTVSLIGDASSIGKLNQAIELKHRRVQCEAAGALARLGDDLGKKRLLELTAEPSARLRAIQYAHELGFADLVDDQYCTDTATAEAEMSLWLSQPQQMGIPPTSVEVVDSRRMLWPSFHDPVDLFLVRFEYSFGDQIYSNVGIAGPVTFAMSTDVADLPMDDIYAIYAGWHAEHPDIVSIPADQFNDVQTRVMGSFQKHLTQLGYESVKPALLGFFLDEQAGVFSALRDAKQCVVVTDGLETVDHPISGRLRPLSPEDLFNLYKGRKMLRTFNSSSQD
jgi:hypothetical protein